MSDNDLQTTDGSAGNSDHVGDVVDQDGNAIVHDGDPRWVKDRLGKMARQRKEAQAENQELRERLARIEGQIEAQANQPAPQPEAPKEKPAGFAGMDDPAEVQTIVTQLEDLRTLSVDPDATAEQRAEAKAQLAKAGNVTQLLAEGYRRMAALEAGGLLDGYRKDFDQRTAASDALNTLTRELLVDYGPESLQQNSDLRKKADSLLRGWVQDGQMSQALLNEPFIIKKAFAEASAELSKNRGGRGSDPRHSAVEGGGGSRGPAPDDAIAALKKRAQSGDFQAGRQANKQLFSNWIEKLRENGQFG